MTGTTTQKKTSASFGQTSQFPVKSVGRLSAETERVMEQVEFAYLPRGDLARAKEICMIIAEVRLLPPSAEVQIAGEKREAWFVSEVYANLTHDHIMMVLTNFKAAKYAIKAKKTYIRTALYNAVFELEHGIENDVQSTIGR